MPLNCTARAALREWLEVRPEPERPPAFGASAATSRPGSGGGRGGHAAPVADTRNLVDAEVTLKKVAALPGHTPLNTTRTYTTPSQADLDRAVLELEG